MKKTWVLCILIVTIFIFTTESSVNAQWAEDGTPACSMTDTQEHVLIVSNGTMGAFIAWDDDRSYQDIYAQMVDRDGQILWTAGGALICGEAQPTLGDLIYDGAYGAIMVWDDYRNFSTRDVYAQRVDQSGDAYWPANGVKLGSDGRNSYKAPRCASDGAGGVIVMWEDERDYNTNLRDIYVNRADSAGNIWTADGYPVCTVAGIQEDCGITSDGSGGAIMVWIDYRGTYPSNKSIFTQRVGPDGTMMWTANGTSILSGVSYLIYEPQVVTDGKRGAIIAWRDNRGTYDVYAQRIDGAGNIKWTVGGIPVGEAAEWQGDIRMIPDGEGGAMITWNDLRDGNYDVYAQKVDSLGTLLWGQGGVPVCTDPSDQSDPVIAPDGNGGCVITWHEFRGTDADIYAQRLDSDGNPLWATDGVPVCDYTGYQANPVICSDGAAGAFIAWEDDRGADTDIYVNSVNYASNEKVATFLASSSAVVDDWAVRIEWTVSNSSVETVFSISRQTDGGGFTPITGSEIERSGDSFCFVDHCCEPSRSYRYRVDVTEEGEIRTLFVTETLTLPRALFALDQNSPNPFNPSTTIWFELAEASQVRLTVYNVKGEKVKVLADKVMSAGRRSVEWDGRTDAGKQVSSGVYFYRLKAGKFSSTRKMVLAR